MPGSSSSFINISGTQNKEKFKGNRCIPLFSLVHGAEINPPDHLKPSVTTVILDCLQDFFYEWAVCEKASPVFNQK